MTMQYDQFGMPIGDDGQPSIDQMQYELAKKGQLPRPLDKVTEHFKTIATQFNPIMMPKVMQDVGTLGTNIASTIVSPYVDIARNIQAAGAAGLHRLAGDEQSALEAEARQRPVTTTSLYREPSLPIVREAEQGLGRAFEASKLPPLGPGSGMPGSAPVSPRPFFTPNDLRVVGAEATRVGRQIGEIPTDFINAQSGLQRIDPVTGQPVIGARLQSAAERLNEIMEQRKMQGLTPIPGLPAVLQPQTSMYAVRPTGTRITTPTIPETAKGHSPTVDPINRFLKSLDIISKEGKPKAFDIVHFINEHIAKQPGDFTQLRNAFDSFVETKALEMFPEFGQPSDAMKAFNVKYANPDAQNVKEAELFDEFIQTPEGQRLMPNAVPSQELSDRHEAAMQGIKNMWGKYFVKNLGTEGNPLVKMAAEKGLTALPEEDIRQMGALSYGAAKSNRGKIGMPTEGSFKARIDETNQKLNDIELPLQNAVNAERSLSAAAHAAGHDPARVPEYREARDKANKLVQDRKRLKAQLDNLTLAAAYENVEDAMVHPSDASTVFQNLSPYERQLYPDLAEAAKRGEKAFVVIAREIERLFKDSAEKFYADVMAGNIDKSRAATYPVDKFIRESAESRIKIEKAKAAEIEAHKNAVLADLKATVDALPTDKKFGNVGVVELTQNTPKVFANRIAAASTEALDICIGEGGGGTGTRNLFTGKKDPKYTPIVNLLTGEPNPNASSHETSWVNAIYKGNELAMFHDSATGMPIAAFQLSKASSLGPNGQQQFNIGYASGAGNKQVERQYIDGIRDYLNSHADKIAGTGDNLEKNTNIFNTKSKHSLRLAQSFAKLSDLEMKAVDWDSQPRFMTAKDIVQVAKSVTPVTPQATAYGPVNIQELKENLIERQTSIVDEAFNNSFVDLRQDVADLLNSVFNVINTGDSFSRSFAQFDRSPIAALTDIASYLVEQIAYRRQHGSEVSRAAAHALEDYLTDIEAARDNLRREQATTQQPTQVTADDVMNAMMLNRPENELHAYGLLREAFDDVFDLDDFRTDPLQVLEDLRSQIRGQSMFVDNADLEELMDHGILDPSQAQLALRELEVASNRLDEITNIIEARNRQAIEQAHQMQPAEQLRQLIDFQTTADPLVNDALQSYSQSLQQYAANQIQNGMTPVEIADHARDTINRLRNLVLSQPTDFTQNFTPDQLNAYVGALRNTIDGIGQWLGEQQQTQPQRANLPAEIQQNIDNRNQQISDAYLNALLPDTPSDYVNTALSEFADLLHDMSTNLYGNGYSTSGIIEGLQNRINREITALRDINQPVTRGLTPAEVNTYINRLNDAHRNLTTLFDAINAQQLGQHQAAQQSREQQREAFDNTVADYINSQISALQNEGTPAATEAIDNILSTITAVAVNTNMFNNPQAAIQRFNQDASQAGNAAARRVLSGIANTIAMNHPDLVAQQPARPEPMVDLNFEPDQTHPANQTYTTQSAIDMARDLFEQERTGADTFDTNGIQDSINLLHEGLFDDQRIRDLAEPIRNTFANDVANRLQNMLNQLRDRQQQQRPAPIPSAVPTQPNIAPYEPIDRSVLQLGLSELQRSMPVEDVNAADRAWELITDVNSPEEIRNIIQLVRTHPMGPWENFSDSQRELLARELEIHVRANPSPNTPPEEAPATELEQHWRNNVFNGDLTERQALASLNNIANNTNLSVEALGVLRSIVNDPDSPQFRVADDDTLRQYNNVIDQAISQRESIRSHNRPTATDNVFGATGQTLRITDRDRELYSELNDMLDNAIEEGYPLPDLGDNEAVARLIMNNEIGGEIGNATNDELRRLASLVRRYGVHGTLPRGHRNGGRIRGYQAGGTVSTMPSVEQMRYELMMRRN